MQPFRAPQGAPAGMRGMRDAGDGRTTSSNMGRRIVSKGLARTQQRAAELGTMPALEVDTTSFEEWMKMATDNKINAANTWSFALIDYFHDMSLLRNDSGDGSINFQKASCTLDGCVKVWTSRVDSVMAETGRLLSGLQDEEEGAQDRADEEQAADDGDESDAAVGRTSKRRRAKETTLASSFAQLQAKRFDLEFSVDPLFKKTSADFDEGGAGGLLMNHLHVDDGMKVVFDASDVAAVVEDSAAESEVAEEACDATAEQAVDIDALRNILLLAAAHTDPAQANQTLEAILQSRILCPSISTFRFSDDNDAQLPSMPTDEHAEMASFELDMDDGMPLHEEEEDFFDGHAAIDDAPEFDVAFMHNTDLAHDDPPSTAPQGHDMLFDYFDNRMKKNWAGPEHWKMARINFAALQKERGPAASVPTEEKPKARRKEALVIDFFSNDAAQSANALFAASATPASIKMPKAAQNNTATHLLPDDQHYNSKRLLRLFLKPKAAILLQNRHVLREPSAFGDEWADACDDAAFQTDLFQENDPYDDVLAPPPFAQDEYDLEDGIDPLRKVRPEYVEYAKRAKQLDVKRLKDNIWRQLQPEDTPPQDVPFGAVLNGLGQLYPKPRLEEISTSFCFICLLHLANEEGLAIDVHAAQDASLQEAVALDDDESDEAKVGRIDQLYVSHDASL
ncbi:hypothetical protein MVES1_001686 [Malassezia vespertilionis]|uniref:Condensin complex subunit 2 n=1 Tax=Malassezia vespertilionis TaxID=2020962 RepID=A0A2N1JDF1_9BASI|nr:uncharacterized protein MVES1_001686 [Malassezia vespertilionis]PKI84564.1 hypothetical protein MVES_001587 [Malassezia vespertilionis]WFD06341.1 hypothetical protein MVES1_001686 [Malassezia vespertilionis]